MATIKIIASRVKERVDALGEAVNILAEKNGLERTYIYSIYKRNARGVQESKFEKLVAALDCDPEYLTGEQDIPRRPKTVVEYGGKCETGVWRPADAPLPPPPVAIDAIAPDPRFPDLPHIVFAVIGEGMAEARISDGMLALTVAAEPWRQRFGAFRSGDIVVARAFRGNGAEQETSIRQVVYRDGQISLIARPGAGQPHVADLREGADVTILAVLVRASLVFG